MNKKTLSNKALAFLQMTSGSGPSVDANEYLRTNRIDEFFKCLIENKPEIVSEVAEFLYKGCQQYDQSDSLLNRMTFIPKELFKGSHIDQIEIPANIKQIESGAFEDCKELRSVIIHSGVTLIDNYAFRNCSSLEEVKWPSTVNTIGTRMFDGCYSLKLVDMSYNDRIAIMPGAFPARLLDTTGSNGQKLLEIRVKDLPSGSITCSRSELSLLLTCFAVPDNGANIEKLYNKSAGLSTYNVPRNYDLLQDLPDNDDAIDECYWRR